jgi:hypothetical protein
MRQTVDKRPVAGSTRVRLPHWRHLARLPGASLHLDLFQIADLSAFWSSMLQSAAS